MLWEAEVARHQRRVAAFDRNDFDAPDAPAEQPVWSDTGLAVAQAIRKHLHTLHIGQPDYIIEAAAYAHHIDDLRQHYGHLIQIVPADTEAAEKGKAEHKHFAELRSRQARLNARIAEIPVPKGLIGKSLFQAFDAYAERIKNVKDKEWNRIEAATTQRLKDSTRDMDLAEFGYSAIERIRDYWAARPNGKRTGKPISVNTVDNHLATLRRFIQWLDRADDYKWESPRHATDATKIELRKLRTDEEVAGQRHGVKVFTLDQLTTIYKHATDFERVLVLLGLNAGMCHAEVLTFRWDEIEGVPPTIKRIRRKNGVYAEAALWTETRKALDWRQALQAKRNSLVMTTTNGNVYTRIMIANTWVTLRKRIERTTGQPCEWWLSFKFLRKTAAQLVRNFSDGEVAGCFLSHGQPVATDDLADVYSNRPFAKVAEALGKVEKQLAPMFDAAPGAFASSKMGRGASKRATAPPLTRESPSRGNASSR